jgi:hypothetical protein
MQSGRVFLVCLVTVALVYSGGIATGQSVTAGAGGEYASLQAAIDAVAADAATPDQVTVVGVLEDVDNVTIPEAVPGITIEAQNPGEMSVMAGLAVFASDATINGLNIEGAGGTGLDIGPGLSFPSPKGLIFTQKSGSRTWPSPKGA